MKTHIEATPTRRSMLARLSAGLATFWLRRSGGTVAAPSIPEGTSFQDVDLLTYCFNWYEEPDSIREAGENRIISCTVVFDENDRVIEFV